MNKKLAIKGHPTRGKEVIELLEMMGGKNFTLDGTNDWYVINDLDNSITFRDHNYINCHEFVKFTLEEFLEKYPYKVGDKVNSPCKGCVKTITSMEWDDYLNTVSYKLDNKIYTTIEQLKVVNDLPYKETNMNDNKFGTAITILASKSNSVKLINHECERNDATFDSTIKKNNENKMKNVLAELLEHIKTTPKEDLEREFEEIAEWSNVGPTVEEFRTFCKCVNKNPKYPKTYEECCQHLGCDDRLSTSKLVLLKQLINARNVYWKIAGEQMGLNKPWEPDWDNLSTNHEFIKINKGCFTYSSRVLVFPTEEMRDAFYENFEDLIEECKELL